MGAWLKGVYIGREKDDAAMTSTLGVLWSDRAKSDIHMESSRRRRRDKRSKHEVAKLPEVN